MSGVFFNKGENCIAAGRIFVEESVHDEFLERVIEETKKMKIGDPLDRSVDHGPQNHLAHLKSLLAYVEVSLYLLFTGIMVIYYSSAPLYTLDILILANKKNQTFEFSC